MNNCGGNCACLTTDKTIDNSDVTSITLDSMGKCPCGKSPDECCHKDIIVTTGNSAIEELCEPHGGKNVC